MALEYDGHRIGAMQYNGVTIGEAMIDGQVVYRSGPDIFEWIRTPVTFSGYDYSNVTFYTEPDDGGAVYEIEVMFTFDNSATATRVMYTVFYDWGTTLQPVFSQYQVSGVPQKGEVTLRPGAVLEHRASINGPGSVTLSGWVTLRHLRDL